VTEPPGLLALDVDGTLLDSRHRIPPAVASAVRRVRALGVPVVLATSRPPLAVWPILARLGLVEPLPFIACQGALTGAYSASGRFVVLDRRPMDVARALAVVALADRHGLSASWFSGERWLVGAVDAQVVQEAEIVGFTPTVADLSAEGEGPEKLLLLSDLPAPGLADSLDLPPGVVVVESTPTHFEVTAAGVDKETALARVCRGLGIARNEVAAMGDGRNDRSMLEWAGTSISPANGHPDVLAVADLVVPSNDEDAVARAVDLLFPS
jgi:hypothetical protein